MPLPVAHGLVGASIVAALHPKQTTKLYSIPLLAGALLANAADVDFFLAFTLNSGSWHRGSSHSLGIAFVILVLFLFWLGKSRWQQATAYGFAFASHGVLDYLTTKHGGGVELLWPFSTRRLALGWWGLSEMPLQLSILENAKALLVEFAIFAPLFAAVLFFRKLKSERSKLTGQEQGSKRTIIASSISEKGD